MINYDMKYAYTEVYEILKNLGDEYRKKVPEKIYKTIKNERKIDYRPKIDFTKPLNLQPLKQETKDLIAYLYYYYWCTDDRKKTDLISKIEENIEKKKQKEKEERRKEIEKRAQLNSSVGVSIDKALKTNNFTGKI